MSLPSKSLLGLTLLLAGLAPAHAAGQAGRAEPNTPLSEMSAAQKKQDQQYFASHSFEFSTLFKSHHPGPLWILEHAAQLELSAAQTQQQELLKLAMAKGTIAGNAALQAAYRKYAADAAVAEPSLAVMTRDIEHIGRAQTRLALVMVPYHLKAYAALTAAQKTVYRKLAAAP